MSEGMGCNLQKKQLLFYNYSREYYTIVGQVGELLTDFLSLDFEFIEKSRIETINNLKDDIKNANDYKSKQRLNNIVTIRMQEKLNNCGLSHIYFSSYRIDHQNELSNLENLNEFQLSFIVSELKTALDFCCNLDFKPRLNTLTPVQRYYLFTNYYTKTNIFDSSIHHLKTGLTINDESFNEKLINFLWDENFDYLMDPFSEEMVTFIQNKTIEPLYIYPVFTVYDCLLFEFTKMIELNIQVKICKNCGKYFILKGDYMTDYCDRVPEGKKSTCKKIAAIRTRKNKVRNNPILKEYERAYKRMYARVSNKQMSRDEFLMWSDEVSIKRDEYLQLFQENPSENLLMDFKDLLGNK